MSTARKLEVAAPFADPVTYSLKQIPIGRIRAFAFQPRKWFDPDELKARAESMRELGQQDPVTVEPVYGDPEHDYELINGESRLRSAQVAGLKTLLAVVRSVPFGSKIEKHLASLVANFNRSDHTPIEICEALHVQMTQGGLRQVDIARAIGKPHNWVRQYLSLRELAPEIQQLLHPALSRKEGRISPATAFELARLPVEKQLEILHQARGRDGKITMHRVQVRASKDKEPSYDRAWTPARHERWLARQVPNDEHVRHLRAGIQEFRAALLARYGRM